MDIQNYVDALLRGTGGEQQGAQLLPSADAVPGKWADQLQEAPAAPSRSLKHAHSPASVSAKALQLLCLEWDLTLCSSVDTEQ